MDKSFHQQSEDWGSLAEAPKKYPKAKPEPPDAKFLLSFAKEKFRYEMFSDAAMLR